MSAVFVRAAQAIRDAALVPLEAPVAEKAIIELAERLGELDKRVTHEADSGISPGVVDDLVRRVAALEQHRGPLDTPDRRLVEIQRRVARLEQDKSLREGAVKIEGPAAAELLRAVSGLEDEEEPS